MRFGKAHWQKLFASNICPLSWTSQQEGIFIGLSAPFLAMQIFRMCLCQPRQEGAIACARTSRARKAPSYAPAPGTLAGISA